MNICVYGASSKEIDKAYIEAGEELGRVLAERGHGLVFGGGANGLMGAVARGAYAKGTHITGVAPGFFNVDGILFEHCTEFIETETMRIRKQRMDELSAAYIMTPGGIGTLDEFFEMLTLKQLGVHKKPIAVLNTMGFYDNLFETLERAAEGGFMKMEALRLFGMFGSPDAVLDYIENYVPDEAGCEDFKHIENGT